MIFNQILLNNYRVVIYYTFYSVKSWFRNINLIQTKYILILCACMSNMFISYEIFNTQKNIT